MRSRVLFLIVFGLALWGGLALSAQATKSQWDGIFTAAQAKRGEEVYTNKCITCHMPDLTGGEPEYTPSPPLTGTEFTGYWNNRTLGGLYDAIQMTMPKDDPGTLKPQESADLTAYILGFNKYPAGTTDLPGDTAALKAIKFLAKKPGT